MKNLINTILASLLITCNTIGQHSNLSLSIGLGAGDGLPASSVYGLEYGYQINPTIELYSKYNQSHTSQERGTLEDPSILAKNTSNKPDSEFIQYYSIGTGAHFHLNRTENASLALTAGGRYASSQRTNVLSTRNGIIDKIELQRNSGVGLELGIGYRRLFLYFSE